MRSARRTWLLAVAWLAIGCSAGQAEVAIPGHGHPPAVSGRPVGLEVPAAIRTEHEHLHHQLEAALHAGGETAARASDVAAVLEPHFEAEESFAMPLLGLLEPLAHGEDLSEAQVEEAIAMADKLRHEYDAMLAEHREITVALEALAAAAREANQPEHAAFAEALMLHAAHEEQVLYPSALLVGRFLEQRQVVVDPAN